MKGASGNGIGTGNGLRRRGSRAGVTLIEVMLAGFITMLVALALFEGVAVASRISRENSELLAADAYAWDTIWQTFNRLYQSPQNLGTTTTTLGEADMPPLYYAKSPAKCYTTVAYHRNAENKIDGTQITVNVEWGPANARRRLSNATGAATAKSFNHVVTVYRSNIPRAP